MTTPPFASHCRAALILAALVAAPARAEPIATPITPLPPAITAPVNPFGNPHQGQSRAVPPTTASDWLDARSMPTTDDPPRAMPAAGSPNRLAFFDATTEDRNLVPDGRVMPLPPVTPEGAIPGPRPPVVGERESPLQQISFVKTLLLGAAGDNIRFVDFALRAVFGFPLPTRESPLVITPGFTGKLVDGPTTTDLPGHLFESFIEIRHLRPVSPSLTVDMAFTPGIYGDYSFVNGTTWRFQGRAAGIWTVNPVTKIIAGLAYIDREDIKFLPIAGVIWTPGDVWKFELVAPRPRISRLLSVNPKRQWLGYMAGEFGGNSYSITRAAGFRDVATYNDLRLLAGAERKADKAGIYWELGWVFARHLEYLSGTPSISPGYTILFRTGAYH